MLILSIVILDKNDQEVARDDGSKGTLTLPDVTLWKPDKAYLYTAKCCIGTPEAPADECRVRFGVRTVKVDGCKFLIKMVHC